jgi:hypothetical protein
MASITENKIEKIVISYLQGLSYTYQLGTVIFLNVEQPEW